jgi:hypothetical protein
MDVCTTGVSKTQSPRMRVIGGQEQGR